MNWGRGRSWSLLLKGRWAGAGPGWSSLCTLSCRALHSSPARRQDLPIPAVNLSIPYWWSRMVLGWRRKLLGWVWVTAGLGRAETCPCLSQQAAGPWQTPWGLPWSLGKGTGQGDAGDPGCGAEPSTGCLLCPPRTAGTACLSLAGDTQACGASLTLRCSLPIPGGGT